MTYDRDAQQWFEGGSLPDGLAYGDDDVAVGIRGPVGPLPPAPPPPPPVIDDIRTYWRGEFTITGLSFAYVDFENMGPTGIDLYLCANDASDGNAEDLALGLVEPFTMVHLDVPAVENEGVFIHVVGLEVTAPGPDMWFGESGPYADFYLAVVPEPATLSLLLLGGLAVLRRRR